MEQERKRSLWNLWTQAGLVLVVGGIFSWLVYSNVYIHRGQLWSWGPLETVEVQANTPPFLQSISRQNIQGGTASIYRNIHTNVGYMVTRNQQGNLISFEQIVNPVGEPQRFNADGSIMPRLSFETIENRGSIRGGLTAAPPDSPYDTYFVFFYNTPQNVYFDSTNPVQHRHPTIMGQ